MINIGTLEAGQVIRYGPALYRVDYVNSCRARIVPLAKRHVTLADGREFDAERGGINIAPGSLVEIIEDLQAAKDLLELEAAEAEVREVKHAIAEQEKIAVVKAVVVAKQTAPPRGEGGWHVAGATTFKPGSLASEVWGLIAGTPGLTTAEIVERCTAKGAVAACVSRFHQAGKITKKPA